MEPNLSAHPSSFRDPSGFIFEKDGVLYRQVNLSYKEHYDHLISSGAYEQFTKSGKLVAHNEINTSFAGDSNGYKTLQPEKIPFISYPWEWSFDMLKDAALLTLQLAKESMSFGLMLKDASVYNIQWRDAQPVLIDTLSFERYDASRPWIAYRQFCEQFLSPLLLMHYSGQDLHGLILTWPEGIPLPVTKSLLPWKSRLSFHTYLHLHLHASLAGRNAGKTTAAVHNFSERKMTQLLDSLQSLVSSLKWKGTTSTWEEYYQEAKQREGYYEAKQKVISQWMQQLQGIKSAADLGANEGAFSLPLAQKNIFTLATDFDHAAINNLYRKLKAENKRDILPLIIDLSSPPPAVGLNNLERSSFLQRTKVDLVLALALIHHLCIGKNIPFTAVASLLSQMCRYLIIEFVPKEDEKVQFMLQQKEDIYINYTETNFIQSFETRFTILKKETITSGRSLYLMRKHE